MQLILLIVTLIVATGPAAEASPEVQLAQSAQPGNWVCHDFYPKQKIISIKDTKITLHLSGRTIDARFIVAGLTHVWAFGGGYEIHIEADGRGLYYDFTNKDTAKPSMVFECKKQS